MSSPIDSFSGSPRALVPLATGLRRFTDPPLPVRSALVLTLGLLALLTGCDTSVDPVVGTDKAFSLYGVLQPRSDTQWVRVYPIEDQLRPLPPEPLGATVTSVDLEGGGTATWRDSVIEEEDGRYAHVYWSPFRAEYDHTYRLEATGDADRTTRADVKVPQKASLEREEPDTSGAEVISRVLVNKEVPRLMRVEVEYYYQYDFRSNVPQGEDPSERVTLSYDSTQHRVEGGWVVPVNLSQDFRTLRDRLRRSGKWNSQFGLALRQLTLRLAVVNEPWNPPGGEFDREVLVEPGLMSNVQNGFGFVGAGYRLRKRWVPSIDVLKKAGWTAVTQL